MDLHSLCGLLIEIWRVKHCTPTSSNSVVVCGMRCMKYTQQRVFSLLLRCSACFCAFYLSLITLWMNAFAAAFVYRI